MLPLNCLRKAQEYLIGRVEYVFEVAILIAEIPPFLQTAQAESKLSPGPDFLDMEESPPQRSGVLSSGTPMTGEIPQPRITAPDGGEFLSKVIVIQKALLSITCCFILSTVAFCSLILSNFVCFVLSNAVLFGLILIGAACCWQILSIVFLYYLLLPCSFYFCLVLSNVILC